MKILTISIAAYNVDQYLEKCLQSIVASKKIDEIEVLIENDGSSDNTHDIGAAFQDKYPNSIKLIDKINGGYGSTINNSIRIASGRYFKQLDGDDWYATDALDEFIESLEKIDAEYIITPYTTRWLDTNVTEIHDPCANIREGIYSFDELNFSVDVPMHSLCFKTEILQKMKRSLDMHCLYTDVELDVFPVIFAEKAAILKTNVYQYMMGRQGQSVNRKSIEKHLDDHKLVMTHVMEAFNEIPISKKGQRLFAERHLVKQMELGLRYIAMSRKSSENRDRFKQFIQDSKNTCPDVYSKLLKESRFCRLADIGNGILYPILRKKAWKD